MVPAARAAILDWAELDLWSPPLGSGLAAPTHSAGRRMTTLGSLVERLHAPVTVEPDAQYRMAGVRWYGEGVFHRETVRGAAMSAKSVSPLVPGALIYNRLFAWKGAFAVVPEELGGCYVSIEFPQFRVAPDVLAEYLHLFFTRQAVMDEVERASTGSAAVSRNRFSERLFARFEISLPDVEEQTRLVRRWRQVREEHRAAHENRRRLSREALMTFLDGLGIDLPSRARDPRPLVVSWQDVDRWGVGFNAQRTAEADLGKARFKPCQLGDLTQLVQYGTSVKANTTGTGTPIIRMGNINEGRFDLTDLKFVQLDAAVRDRLLLKDGDVLFNRTNSKELVGKCAVFHEPGEYVFASYLIRLRFDTAVVDPDFIAYVINSPIGRRQIDALSRQIIGQANINARELRSLQTPLPPLFDQQRMIKAVSATEDRALARVRQAEAALPDEDRRLQAAVLGFT